MAFESSTSLMSELDALGDSTPEPLRREWWPSEPEVGANLVAIAAGKFSWSGSDIETDERRQMRRRVAAQRVIVAMFLRDDASYYEHLALRCDAGSEQIREAYRRMIALVHPDSSPSGFPPDAATRVNLAYATLTDSAKRAAYDAERRSVEAAATRSLSASGAHNASGASAAMSRRRMFRASRRVLLWIGACLTLASALLAYLIFPRGHDAELVEARPKLKLALAVDASTAPARAPTLDDVSPVRPDGGAPSYAPQTMAAADITATSERSVASSLSTQLSAESRRRLYAVEKSGSDHTWKLAFDDHRGRTVDRVGVRPTLETELVRTVPGASNKPLDVAALTLGIETPTSPLALNSSPASTLEPTGARTPPPEASGNAEGSAKNALATGLGRNPPIDPDEVLFRLVTAYESGSAVAIDRLLSPRMQERHKLLASYEKLFRDTSARSLRLGQLRHQRMDGRIRSSGPAIVLTTSRDSAPSEVRVFLEIDIVRDKDQIFIERIASYAAQ